MGWPICSLLFILSFITSLLPSHPASKQSLCRRPAGENESLQRFQQPAWGQCGLAAGEERRGQSFLNNPSFPGDGGPLALHLNHGSPAGTRGTRPGVPPLPLPPSTLDSPLRPLRLLLRQWLRCQPEDSLVRQQDLVGLTGEVRLGCSRSQRGLVRLRVRGCLIEARAYGSDARPLLRGDRVLVLHHQDDHLWVTRLGASDP